MEAEYDNAFAELVTTLGGAVLKLTARTWCSLFAFQG